MDRALDDARKRAVYRFRPGALEAIARSRNITSDRGLATLLRLSEKDLAAVRRGTLVGLPMAVHVAQLMGTGDNLSIWTELAD